MCSLKKGYTCVKNYSGPESLVLSDVMKHMQTDKSVCFLDWMLISVYCCFLQCVELSGTL